jgi:hypothetical protein
MKKLTSLVALFVIVFAFNVNAQQKKLAYITALPIATTGNLAGDTLFIQAFAAAGFDVDTISAAAALPPLSGYDVLVLSAVPNSGGTGLAALKDSCLKKPFVNLKSFQLQSTRWKWVTPTNNAIYSVKVPDAMKNHPLYDGITLTGAGENEILLSSATSGNGVVSVAFTAGFALETVVCPTLANVEVGGSLLPSYFEIPIGSLVSGVVTAHKQVVLGLSESAWAGLTPDAVKLAVNAAKYVITPGNFVKQWNWERWSAATIAQLTADTLLSDRSWLANEFNAGVPTRFKNAKALSGVLKANGDTIAETKGISLPNQSSDKFRLLTNYGNNGFQFNGNWATTIQNLKAGQYVKIILKSGSAGTPRGISAINNMTGEVGTSTYGNGNADVTYNFTVLADGNVTFTNNAGVVVKQILLTQSPVATVDVATPVVAIAYNTTSNVKTVTITCATPSAEIYYTTDGTNPTKASTRYTAPFDLSAESFTVIARAWLGESPSPDFGKKAWTDPFTFDATADYYIYSFGKDEGNGISNPKYIYAGTDTIARWMDVAAEEDLATKLNAANDYSARWILESGADFTVKFKNKTTGKYMYRITIPYTGDDAATGNRPSIGLGTVAQLFYVAYRQLDNSKPSYSIHLNNAEGTVLEINNGSKEKTESLDNNPLLTTVQCDNAYAGDDGSKIRARFRWVIEKIPGTGTGVNTPNNSGKTILSERYFDVLGKEATQFSTGVVIKKITYTDGSVENQKIMILK